MVLKLGYFIRCLNRSSIVFINQLLPHFYLQNLSKFLLEIGRTNPGNKRLCDHLKSLITFLIFQNKGFPSRSSKIIEISFRIYQHFYNRTRLPGVVNISLKSPFSACIGQYRRPLFDCNVPLAYQMCKSKLIALIWH